MTTKDWILLLIPMTASIISIFISNYLGVRNINLKNKLEIQQKTYIEYHVPLMQWLMKHRLADRNYARLVAMPYVSHGEQDFLITHISQNLNYTPKSVIKIFSEYLDISNPSEFYNYKSSKFDTPEAEKDAIKSSELFDKIITESLQEAKELSNKLGYPDISEPILCSYVERIYMNGRHVPWTTRK